MHSPEQYQRRYLESWFGHLKQVDFLRGPGLLDLSQILLDRELRAERCG